MIQERRSTADVAKAELEREVPVQRGCTGTRPTALHRVVVVTGAAGCEAMKVVQPQRGRSPIGGCSCLESSRI